MRELSGGAYCCCNEREVELGPMNLLQTRWSAEDYSGVNILIRTSLNLLWLLKCNQYNSRIYILTNPPVSPGSLCGRCPGR